MYVLARRSADIGPLTRFLPPAAVDRLAVRAVDAAEMPANARALLDHDRDMTSTLEAWMEEPLKLRVLARQRQGDELVRQVVLIGERSGRAAEFGAIVIHLERFPAAARRDIIVGQRPLGSLLAAHDVSYLSQPRAFLSLCADTDVARALGPGITIGENLWGRSNVLETPDGEDLARVVEILPPALAG